MSAFPMRGEVYFVDLRSAQGSEQQGIRPALIVSNNLHNQFSPVVTIVPITHTVPKRHYPQNVGIPAGLIDQLPSTIYCGQIQTIDRRRFRRCVGRLDSSILDEVAVALRQHLDI